MDYIGRFGPPQPQYNGSITPPLFVGKICREEPAVDMIKKIQFEIEKKASDDAESKATLAGVKPKFDISITKGFMVMETKEPKSPKGAYSVQNYDEAFDDGCIVRVVKKPATAEEATETRERNEMCTVGDQSQELDKCSTEADQKYLSCFHVDSDIDNIAMAMARLGIADMSLHADEEELCGIDGDNALIQLRHVLEDRNQIRSHTDQLMQDHIFRMNRDRMLALRQPFTCFGCGIHEKKQ